MLALGAVCGCMLQCLHIYCKMSMEIMLSCYFWITRYKTITFHAQIASQTMVNEAFQSNTGLEEHLHLHYGCQCI